MTPGLLSIVIPCFNDAPEHLAESVGSALNQDYAPIEVIVVDDGSTEPATVAKLRELTDVTLVRRTNGGTGSALNTGIARSSGEYILPLGADDRIAPDFARWAVSALQSADDSVVAIYPRVEYFGLRSGELPAPTEVNFSDLVVRNKVVTSAVYRRAAWDLVGGYGAHNDSSEDWYFWAVLLGRTGGRMMMEPRARLYYRVRDGSRNTVNRGMDAKNAARRHIAEALPERLQEMYLAAADVADHAIADAERYSAFIDLWKRRLGPALAVRRALQKVRRGS